MTSPFTENEITRKLTEVLEYDFRVSPAEANHTQIYKALSKIVVNYLKEKRSMFMTDCNSKGRNSSRVDVDYTFIRNVKKPNGSKPGMVIFTNNYTITVKPDTELEEKLRV